MLKRKNDRQPQSMEELYPDDYWLDEEDGEELPDPAMKRRPVSGRLHDEPMVTGYEALERQRGVRRPNRKLTRREKKALKRAQKYEEKLHKEHEKADKKNAKREAKLAARAEKQAVRDAKKNAKKKKSRPAAEASTKTKVVSLKMSLRHQKAAWRFPARQCSAFTMKITAAQPSISALRETAQAGRSRHSARRLKKIKCVL